MLRFKKRWMSCSVNVTLVRHHSRVHFILQHVLHTHSPSTSAALHMLNTFLAGELDLPKLTTFSLAMIGLGQKFHIGDARAFHSLEGVALLRFFFASIVECDIDLCFYLRVNSRPICRRKLPTSCVDMHLSTWLTSSRAACMLE